MQESTSDVLIERFLFLTLQKTPLVLKLKATDSFQPHQKA